MCPKWKMDPPREVNFSKISSSLDYVTSVDLSLVTRKWLLCIRISASLSSFALFCSKWPSFPCSYSGVLNEAIWSKRGQKKTVMLFFWYKGATFWLLVYAYGAIPCLSRVSPFRTPIIESSVVSLERSTWPLFESQLTIFLLCLLGDYQDGYIPRSPY